MKLYNVLYSLLLEVFMPEPFFPRNGKRVVPLVTIDHDEDITFVEASPNKHSDPRVHIRIIRLAIGSLFKASVIKIDSPDLVVERDPVKGD